MGRGALRSQEESMGKMATFGFGRDVILLGSGTCPSTHRDGRAYEDEMEDLLEEDVMRGSDCHCGEQNNEQALRMLAEMKISATPDAANKSLRRGRRSWLSVEMETTATRKNELNKTGVESNDDGGRMEVSKKESLAMSIPQLSNAVSEYSSGWSNGAHNAKGVPQSAPLVVPAWAKVLGLHLSKDEGEGEGVDDEEEAYGGSMRLPPHEVIARQHAATFSVFEGTGRTLKGMDMRRVRYAVWRRTGFID